MNLEYKITFQDDLDAEETRNEYSWGVIRGVAISLCLSSLVCIVWGFIEQTDPDAIWLITIGCLGLLFGIAYPFIMQPKIAQSFFNRRAKQKEWSKKPSLQEVRNIIITNTEFIFKTEHSETAWKWKVFKRLFEGEKCFLR